MRDCGSHVSYCAGRPANILVVLQSGLDFAAGTLN
jgi:predicted RNA binding protein YcfA (HicA-like mRNA interferase family)